MFNRGLRASGQRALARSPTMDSLAVSASSFRISEDSKGEAESKRYSIRKRVRTISTKARSSLFGDDASELSMENQYKKKNHIPHSKKKVVDYALVIDGAETLPDNPSSRIFMDLITDVNAFHSLFKKQFLFS